MIQKQTFDCRFSHIRIDSTLDSISYTLCYEQHQQQAAITSLNNKATSIIYLCDHNHWKEISICNEQKALKHTHTPHTYHIHME